MPRVPVRGVRCLGNPPSSLPRPHLRNGGSRHVVYDGARADGRGTTSVAYRDPMTLTPAQNLWDAFENAGADKLRMLAEHPTAVVPGQMAVIAQSLLVIEQDLIEQASTGS